MNEWDTDNVIMAGTSDGVVKIYSCIMVENDGSVDKPAVTEQRQDTLWSHRECKNFSKKSAASANFVAEKLEKQRRRLKVASGSQEQLCSSEQSHSHSPEPPGI
jgi:hypothetical protein